MSIARVRQRIIYLERSAPSEAATCVHAPPRVFFEIDGERLDGSSPCPACGDRDAITVSFVATPLRTGHHAALPDADPARSRRALARACGIAE